MALELMAFTRHGKVGAISGICKKGDSAESA